MKARITAVLMFTVAASTWTWTQATQAQEAASPAPLEAFFCNMQPGKDMKDLMQVTERFKKWSDKNDSGYSAWILTPRFGQFRELPQVLWLGGYASGNAMGKGLDDWMASGSDIQAAFDSVIDCGAHSLASSIEISSPDGPPGDGVVMFTQCSIEEGSDWSKAVAAHKNYSSAMRSLGAKNSNYMFFPMLGGTADRNFDYWGVSTFKSWTDYFAAYELYVNGGGWQKGMKAMEGVANCEQGTPTVWDVKLVRNGAS
jgi:hypothetical protein